MSTLSLLYNNVPRRSYANNEIFPLDPVNDPVNEERHGRAENVTHSKGFQQTTTPRNKEVISQTDDNDSVIIILDMYFWEGLSIIFSGVARAF